MNTHDKYELPPLPKYTLLRGLHTSENMQKYARTAIEPYQQRIAELESQLEAIGAGGVSSQRITSPSRGEAVAWPTHEFAIVVDRIYEGEGPSLAMWNGENYNFTDGDCYDREPDGSLDGYTAEWLTHHQLEQRLFSQQPAEPNEHVVVSRRDIKVWRNEWLEANDPGDGTDCVTPFDKYLYNQPAAPAQVPSEDERAAQGLPPYNPRHLTEEEWIRLVENGRKAWGKKDTESTKDWWATMLAAAPKFGEEE